MFTRYSGFLGTIWRIGVCLFLTLLLLLLLPVLFFRPFSSTLQRKFRLQRTELGSPYFKFWLNTICYFLFVIVVVSVSSKGSSDYRYSSKDGLASKKLRFSDIVGDLDTQFSWIEVVMYIWVFSYISGKIEQLLNRGMRHFFRQGISQCLIFILLTIYSY